MVDVKTEFVDPGERTRLRMEKLRKASTPKGVRVVPAAGEGFTEEDMRLYLKHPKAGAFRSEGDIEWPNDTFTQRRLAEGSIKLASEPTKPSSAGQSKGGG